MDVKDIKHEKNKLVNTLEEAIQNFQKKTGTRIVNIDYHRVETLGQDDTIFIDISVEI